MEEGRKSTSELEKLTREIGDIGFRLNEFLSGLEFGLDGEVWVKLGGKLLWNRDGSLFRIERESCMFVVRILKSFNQISKEISTQSP
jgi:hypothetical protein